MKRVLLPLVALGFLLNAIPAIGQIKQEGWWIMDRVEIINKSDCKDFSYSGTSVTYRNEKTWQYYANGKGEDGKLHTVSDVISIMIDWSAPPAHIQCGKEGEISMNYSMIARPDTYENKNFRRMRPTPFYSLEMRLQLKEKGQSASPFTIEWDYSAPKDKEWGYDSGQFKPRGEPGGHLFAGVDVSKGMYELTLRIWVDIAGGDLERWDEGKEYRNGYVLVHHYHYSRDMFDSMANPKTEDKTTTATGDGFESLDDMDIQSQREYLEGMLERTQEELQKEKAKGPEANPKKLSNLNRAVSSLKRQINNL